MKIRTNSLAAIYVTILSNKLDSFVPTYVSNAASENGVPSSSILLILSNITTGTLASEQALIPGLSNQALGAVNEAVEQAYADSFRYVFYAVVAFGILAIGCACLTVNYSSQFTNNVARKLHGSGTGEKGDNDDMNA
jgi:Fungal trichothecene efflux pump (TRI12)